MSTLDLNTEDRFPSIGTLDIETSGFDGGSEHLIAVGVGYYKADGGDAEVAVHTQKDFDGDEAKLIRTTYEWLNERNPDALTTYGGEGFDFEFLDDKQTALGVSDGPDLACRSNHIDLFEPRKSLADKRNNKWPSLEESLKSYEIPEYETTWRNAKLDNTMFGEELAPEYVAALEDGDTNTLDALETIVHEYTETDIEGNIALYEHDVGREYMPTYAR
ncbi:ribonuclease H-like domain-containing protein [Halorussus pelagicus]|uniref:ribonuclease H-like domain-containing protein n=1 Tax=Halorussus pelagicus TaxID=2505977 RepID=UPI00140D8D5E|nr:ribonuclease H-like domain-containing protein [Halorussus pelagicus]